MWQKGNYNVRKTLNDKGQKSLIKYNKSGVPISIKAQNYQNKTYTNKHFAAKVLGIKLYEYDNDLRDESAAIHGLQKWENHPVQHKYRWNEKEHCFKFINQKLYSR